MLALVRYFAERGLQLRKGGFVGVLLVFLAALQILAPVAEAAGKRLAFVVGIDAYDNLGPLRQLTRSVNDARAISDALGKFGYQGTPKFNLKRSEFNDAWQTFLDSIVQGDTVAVFFSGHGVEVEGQNYILPRDVPFVKFGRQEQLKSESISISGLLLDLRGRDPQVILMILDACRDNPFIPAEFRKNLPGGSGGLAGMEAAMGEFIMYSAAAGQTANEQLYADDPVQNSVYVRNLLPLMRQANLPIHVLARRLRDQVYDLSSKFSRYQFPTYYDGIRGEFCLDGCQVVASGDQPAAALEEIDRSGAGQLGASDLSEESTKLIECYLAGRADWKDCT